MSYEEALGKLAKGTGRGMVAIHGGYASGATSRAAAMSMAETLLLAAGNKGQNVAHLAYRGVMDLLLDDDTAPSAALMEGLTTSRTSRTASALETVFGGDEEALLMRMERLGLNLPVDMAQQAFGVLVKADQRVSGWTRTTEAEACELCEWLADDGKVWPPDHPMPAHPGCMCQQTPVVGR